MVHPAPVRQVVCAYRLLERLPHIVVSLLLRHLCAAAAEQQQSHLAGFLQQRRALEQLLEQHKRQLHPSMLHIGR
jgi:hypothetical protein